MRISCIGLKDKNGIQLYSGDTVAYTAMRKVDGQFKFIPVINKVESAFADKVVDELWAALEFEIIKPKI